MPTRDEIIAELSAIEVETKRLQYLRDPVLWAKERAGIHLWSKQRETLRSIVKNRQTAVRSAHGTGKSFVAAVAACWWIDVHLPGEAFVVSSAPTARQVRNILWREIGRIHARCRLNGRLNQTEWWMTMPEGNEEIVGFGSRPADIDPSAFQGIHAPYVLVIIDEACGFPKVLWEPADSLTTNEDSRELAIGNPDDPITEFAEVCKPGSGWNVIGISAFDTPNLTGEIVPPLIAKSLVSKIWVDERLRKWGEANPFYISKVLGQFPEQSIDGLILIRWIREAQQRDCSNDTGPKELGVDVGGGGDKSVIAARKGGRVRIVHKDQNPNTMQLVGNVVFQLREQGAGVAKIDKNGIGYGATDRLVEMNLPIVGVMVGDPAPEPFNEGFANIRAWGYWHLREIFQDGIPDIDPNDDDLAAQLVDLKYQRQSQGGRIVMESKKDMKKRGRPSPDEADAVMLCFLPSEYADVVVMDSATWGR